MAKKVSINKLLRTDDAFLSTSEKIFLYCKSHTRAIVVAAIVVAVLGLAGFIIKSVHDSKVTNSLAAFHRANIVPDLDARAEALRAVRTDYPGTKAARQAAYGLLDNYLATADVEEALPLLDELIKTADASEESLKPLMMATQAGLLEQVGQLDLALESYKSAVSLVDKGQVTPIEEPFLAELLSSIGRVNLALGRTDDARKAYEDVILRTPSTYRSYTAQVKLYQTAPTTGEAKAAPGAEPATNAATPAVQATGHEGHNHGTETDPPDEASLEAGPPESAADEAPAGDEAPAEGTEGQAADEESDGEVSGE